MSFPFRTELVAENRIFGTQPAVWQVSEVSHFLKKIFGLSLLASAGVCDCFTLELLPLLQIDKRVARFYDYLLENHIDADSTFRLPVCFECTALP